MHSPSAHATPLPRELFTQLGEATGWMERAASRELSPYSARALDAAARRAAELLAQLPASDAGRAELARLLPALTEEARAAALGRVSFPEQLEAHLREVHQQILTAVAEREVAPELALAFQERLHALEGRAQKPLQPGDMEALFRAVTALEMGLEKRRALSRALGRDARGALKF